MTSAAQMPVNLTEGEKLLRHALCFCATSRIYDDRLDDVIARMWHLLDSIPARHANAAFRPAALAICEAFGRRNQPNGAAAWMLANIEADTAAQRFHWNAFCYLAGHG